MAKRKIRETPDCSCIVNVRSQTIMDSTDAVIPATSGIILDVLNPRENKLRAQSFGHVLIVRTSKVSKLLKRKYLTSKKSWKHVELARMCTRNLKRI